MKKPHPRAPASASEGAVPKGAWDAWLAWAGLQEAAAPAMRTQGLPHPTKGRDTKGDGESRLGPEVERHSLPRSEPGPPTLQARADFWG